MKLKTVINIILIILKRFIVFTNKSLHLVVSLGEKCYGVAITLAGNGTMHTIVLFPLESNKSGILSIR